MRVARRLGRGLRNPFVLLLVGLVILPVSLIGLLAARDHDAGIETATDVAQRTVYALAEHGARVFESNVLALDLINDQIADLDWAAIQAGGPRLYRQMSQVGRGLEQTNVLLLIDREGRTVIETSRPYGSPSIDVSNRDYFRAHAGGDTSVFVGPVLRGVTTNSVVFHVSRPRVLQDGRQDGVLAVSLFPSYFVDVWRTLIENPADNVALVRNDGLLLAHWSTVPDFESSFARQRDRLQARLVGDTGVYRTSSLLDGRDRMVAYRRVGTLPVHIVYGLSLDDAFAAWRRTWAAVAAAGGIGIGALAWMTLVAMRRSRKETEARAELATTASRLRDEIARREATEAAALRAQKMEALGQLTGGVAHDINNLLTAIGGNLRLMADDVADRSRRRLTSAIEAVDSAGSVTRQLLAFSRREAVNVEAVDVNETVRRMGPLIDRAIRADIRLTLDLTSDRTVSALDPGQLEACLLNLASNARDAMPGSGELTIRTFTTELRDRQDGFSGRFVGIEVADTGLGMDAEVAARAFDPFFTTKEVGQGTGLGLSTVYAFARQSGGTAEIETEPGGGTVLRILLPVSDRAPATKDALPSVPPVPASTRVLVVEDSVLVRMVTEDALRRAGFEVVGAGDSIEAGRILDEQPPFQMMVTDVVMPRGVSGIDLARDAVRRHPAMKVLLVSGYSREHLTGLGDEEGYELMAKPFTPDDLTRRVWTILNGPTPAVGAVGGR